jgi:acetyltransferase
MSQYDREGTWTLADGTKLKLRHIAAADATKEQAFVHGLSVQSSYLRFHGTLKNLSKKELKNFTEPDSRNAVALIVLHCGESGEEEEIGVARYVIDTDRANCEFAIVVADAWQKRGIGKRLMNALTSHLQASGIKQISGSVLKSNSAMLTFIKQLGFAETAVPDDLSTVMVTKQLDLQASL